MKTSNQSSFWYTVTYSILAAIAASCILFMCSVGSKSFGGSSVSVPDTTPVRPAKNYALYLTHDQWVAVSGVLNNAIGYIGRRLSRDSADIYIQGVLAVSQELGRQLNPQFLKDSAIIQAQRRADSIRATRSGGGSVGN